MATITSADPGCRFTDSESQCTPVTDKRPPLLTDPDINKIAERKLRSNRFRVLRWSLDSLDETNGYMGQYYTLTVTVRIGECTRDLIFFAKTPPHMSSPQYEFLMRFNTFDKEMIVYSEMVPNMGKGSGHKWAPDFYFGKSNTVLVLENATHEGYVMPDKYVALDEDHCIWAVKALCLLHSRSLILDEKLRRSTGQTILDLYGHLLVEVAFVEHDVPAEKYLKSCVTGASTIVDLVESMSEQEKTEVKARIARWILKLPTLLGQSTKFRNVVVHRDTWVNNMMFKDDAAGKPIGCYLIDFQFLRYCPPAIDFMTSICLITDRATRSRCFDTFVDVYCDTMRMELAKAGLDVNECLPRREFVESCEVFRPIALAYSVANLQIMLLTKQAVEQYFVGSTDQLEYVMYGEQRSQLVLSQCAAVKAYQTRIVEVIEEIKEHMPEYPPDC